MISKFNRAAVQKYLSSLIINKKMLGKVFIGLVCAIIITNYTTKAIKSSKAQHISYSNWLNSNFDGDDANEQLAKTTFSVTLPDNHGALHWQISGSESDPQTNQRLERLMQLAKSSSIFSEEVHRSQRGKILVTLTNQEKTFSANLTRKQIERLPELRTFFKLFEIYASSQTNSVAEGDNSNENS